MRVGVLLLLILLAPSAAAGGAICVPGACIQEDRSEYCWWGAEGSSRWTSVVVLGSEVARGERACSYEDEPGQVRVAPPLPLGSVRAAWWDEPDGGVVEAAVGAAGYEVVLRWGGHDCAVVLELRTDRGTGSEETRCRGAEPGRSPGVAWGELLV